MKLRHLALQISGGLLLALFSLSCAGLGVKVSGLDPIAQAAKSLSEGLKGVDPIGANRSAAEAADLRSQLAALQQRLSTLSLGYGVVTLKDRRLALRVPYYTGSFLVTAWVDDRTNWAWQDRTFADRELFIPLVAEDAFTRYCVNEVTNNVTVCSSAGQRLNLASNAWGVVQYIVGTEVPRATREMLTKAPLVPVPENDLINIGESKMTDGNHSIVFEVTPIASDQTGKWIFRGQLVVIGADGTEMLIKEFDLQSARYPGQPFGKPISPPVTAVIQVATSKPN